MSKTPNFTETLEELDAGLLLSKLSKITADVALSVIQHRQKGKVVLTLDIAQIAESAQVNVTHKINFIKPTKRGDATEKDTTVTPMHVNRQGHLTVAPENQADIFKQAQEQA